MPETKAPLRKFRVLSGGHSVGAGDKDWHVKTTTKGQVIETTEDLCKLLNQDGAAPVVEEIK